MRQTQHRVLAAACPRNSGLIGRGGLELAALLRANLLAIVSGGPELEGSDVPCLDEYGFLVLFVELMLLVLWSCILPDFGYFCFVTTACLIVHDYVLLGSRGTTLFVDPTLLGGEPRTPVCHLYRN